MCALEDHVQRHLVDRYLDAYNHFDIEAMLALLSPDIRFENYSNGQLTASADGIAQFRALAEHSRTLFSERGQQILSLELGEDSGLARIAFRGRLAVDIDGGPKAGTVLELIGTTGFSFRDGRITRIVDRS